MVIVKDGEIGFASQARQFGKCFQVDRVSSFVIHLFHCNSLLIHYGLAHVYHIGGVKTLLLIRRLHLQKLVLLC